MYRGEDENGAYRGEDENGAYRGNGITQRNRATET
jgi:hypothetical protein